MHRILVCIVLALVGASSLPAGVARASTFNVSPIVLTLSAQVTTGMLTVTNKGAESLRFHVTAFAWDEKPNGDMALEPTKEIVFFPAMLMLNPGEARKLRIGMNVRPGAREKSYRVFVQELPPLATSPDDLQGRVRVLTKMGIPVFIEPASPKATPQLTIQAVQARTMTFSVKNAGNVHFRSEKVVLSARDAGGKVVHREELTGWYVLAGGLRTYVVELPREACATLTSLQVELESDKGPARATLADAHCGP